MLHTNSTTRCYCFPQHSLVCIPAMRTEPDEIAVNTEDLVVPWPRSIQLVGWPLDQQQSLPAPPWLRLPLAASQAWCLYLYSGTLPLQLPHLYHSSAPAAVLADFAVCPRKDGLCIGSHTNDPAPVSLSMASLHQQHQVARNTNMTSKVTAVSALSNR